MKVAFVPVRSLKEVEFSEQNLNILQPYSKVGLFAAIQFQDQLPEIKKALEIFGLKVLIPKPKLHAVADGQVLGCDVSGPKDIENEVDAFLYIGTGHFHPMALETKTNKPILCLNPFTSELTETPAEEIALLKKKNIMRLAKAKDARVLGLLVTTKLGQNEMQGYVSEVKKKLEAMGKEVYVFITELINPYDLSQFPQIEAWVNTACPRITDDQSVYGKPLINVREILE
ncbi:MAG: diphthamide synthesis protein [DPANN group archaeon]|nr:diphthamide synthesis protein [DPANN group archaeon]